MSGLGEALGPWGPGMVPFAVEFISSGMGQHSLGCYAPSQLGWVSTSRAPSSSRQQVGDLKPRGLEGCEAEVQGGAGGLHGAKTMRKTSCEVDLEPAPEGPLGPHTHLLK